jgi:hypothetical protein
VPLTLYACNFILTFLVKYKKSRGSDLTLRDFVIQYWAEVLFGTIITGIGACYRCLWRKVYKQMCDQQAIKDGTQALLRNQIIHSYDKYIERGWLPIYAMENVLAMYNAYHKLGGNGAITKLIEELRELPSNAPKG